MNQKRPHRRAESSSWFVKVHRDESGSISIASVFALLMLVFILGMVMNSTRQVDRKVKMQNAADAATRAGTLQVTRSMNAIAFTNHLNADVFALTAFFREARDQNAAAATAEILDHWRRVGPELERSEFPPFAQLGRAINEKVPREEELVASYTLWAYAASQTMLPVFEAILDAELIPTFQRSLVLNTPRLAQYAADQVARRHGRSWPVSVELRAVLWRTIGDPVGGLSEDVRRTLPVVDPVLDVSSNQSEYYVNAVSQRHSLSHRYLDEWNDESMRFFDSDGKMSQFGRLWRTFTCGQLTQLLGEHPTTNLPMQLRQFNFVLITDPTSPDDPPVISTMTTSQQIELDYMFVGVVYAEKLFDRIPRMFANPIDFNSIAYAQAEYFVPHRRLVLPTINFIDQPFDPAVGPTRHRGGVPGDFVGDPPRHAPRDLLNAEKYSYNWPPRWVMHRQSGAAYPTQWDLLTQNWESQLVPATCEQLPFILSKPPEINGVEDLDLADLSQLSPQDMSWLNHH